ncbi:MAG: hypothetical protein CSA19_01215 [Deltaproteobacteria bacterium]|nr:MAG: hypothetical protein CSA19_01215 [Deltaproteobacteria bacterium]
MNQRKRERLTDDNNIDIILYVSFKMLGLGVRIKIIYSNMFFLQHFGLFHRGGKKQTKSCNY